MMCRPVPTLSSVMILLQFCAAQGLFFKQKPQNATVSVGKLTKLNCSAESGTPAVMRWIHDGVDLGASGAHHVMQFTLPLPSGWYNVVSMLKIDSVHRSDAGIYTCKVSDHVSVLEASAFLEIQGLPSFTEEPEPLAVLPGHPFNLTCSAQGPPEPVKISWHLDGKPWPGYTAEYSPSVLDMPGIWESCLISCHASNSKGVRVSPFVKIVVKVPPQAPSLLRLVQRSNHSVSISWEVPFDGHSPITSCKVQTETWEDKVLELGSTTTAPLVGHRSNLSLQRKDEYFEAPLVGDHSNMSLYREDEDLEDVGDGFPSNVQNTSSVTELVKGPLNNHTVTCLSPATFYHTRVSCGNDVGFSNWSAWLNVSTAEGVPSTSPSDLHLLPLAEGMNLSWAPVPQRQVNGILLGYKVLYRVLDSQQEVLDVGLQQYALFNISLATVGNLTMQVLAYTDAGDGPPSESITVSTHPPGEPVMSFPDKTWTPVLVGILFVVLIVALIGLIVAGLKRRKETAFGHHFCAVSISDEPVVSYRAQQSFSRHNEEVALAWLGVSEEVKSKLQDVLLERRHLILGKVLGEGEFGSVIEGSLCPEGSADDIKVAVKTMKMDICSRSEMDEFLSEAVCMKDFDHPNVICLIGVCLETSVQHRVPRPMVIIPFMQHGDLHSFLLRSRIGDNPSCIPLQSLMKFMIDAANGMEYLASKNFIHRDLAARNCMLHENMRVCVADFGLSKKIYSGDYYRQGRISKMPVKWIAIESLADRLYTTKSDVWSFGVTMWEIVTRGQMPYPGIQNHEIYDYLQQGYRLKQPSDCLDDLYAIMSSCWHVNPSERSSFDKLRRQLEDLLKSLPEIIYVNTEDMPPGAAGGLLDPSKEADHGLENGAKLPEDWMVFADVHCGVDEPEKRYVVPPSSELQHNKRAITSDEEFV
uniref:receptor protein-tyrosine kinase n=1 Tax=Eptatretus burgeri TaxID=7764 RepID=A0A8C4N862_EPTBU